MRVCNVCYGEPEWQGRPTIDNMASGDGQYLIHTTDNSGERSGHLDLCKLCFNAFRKQDWAGLHERSQEGKAIALSLKRWNEATAEEQVPTPASLL